MSELGKPFRDGEVIVQQGDTGDCMYVVQKGKVEVLTAKGGADLRLAVLGEGDFFGEMALFEREVRSATVRALGDVWVLTLEKKSFLRKVQEDPSLAFRILEKMSHRIRELDIALEEAAARRSAR
ncbi:MAG: cyclic nucleotide-binding domain-containing protein [Acidobacteriia bacterium]|nr:cyclic nucleotide-binding domain-containing protein [Terriglobia bacterium]